MELKKYVLPSLLAVLILSNMALSFLLLDNQLILVENQEKIASHLDSLTAYLAEISGEMLTVDGQQGRFNIEIHMQAIHRNSDGVMIGFSEHAGTLTTIGKNWIEDQISDSPNATSIAKYISLSNNAGAPGVAWTEIPEEIAANNLTRSMGVYASTGDGVWTVTYTFTASGNQACQLAGLQWDSTDESDNNLLCADQMTAVSMVAADTLQITWTITVT